MNLFSFFLIVLMIGVSMNLVQDHQEKEKKKAEDTLIKKTIDCLTGEDDEDDGTPESN